MWYQGLSDTQQSSTKDDTTTSQRYAYLQVRGRGSRNTPTEQIGQCPDSSYRRSGNCWNERDAILWRYKGSVVCDTPLAIILNLNPTIFELVEDGHFCPPLHWFVGKVVAQVLGYQNPSEAMADHVDPEDKLNSKTLSSFQLELGQRGGWIINESGLNSLVLRIIRQKWRKRLFLGKTF